VPILALVVEPTAAAAIKLPLPMTMDVAAPKSCWRQWHWPGRYWQAVG